MKHGLLIILISLSLYSKGQTIHSANNKNPKVELGLLFSQVQNTFSSGISLTSMHLKDHLLFIRMRGNYMFDNERNYNAFIGLTHISQQKETLFIYTEGGLYGTTKTYLKANKYAGGIYALIGMDIGITRFYNAFIEAGTTGTNETMNYMLNAGVRLRL